MPQDVSADPIIDISQFGNLGEFDAAIAKDEVTEEVQYPAIALTVKNQVPMITLHTDAEVERVLIKADQGIDTAMLDLADKVNLNDFVADELMSELMTGDETLVSFPELEVEDQTEINLSRLVRFASEMAAQSKQEYSAEPAVVAQLERNWAIDVLASTREEIYNILIAHAIRLAEEFAIDNIQLRDHRRETRLVEKMSKELAHGGVELVVL